jgi:TorA maturation chaperone TorD
MAGLIDGTLGDLSLEAQKDLYERHIGSWAPYFFRDLQSAPSADLYAAVAALGAQFLLIEEQAFRMVQSRPAAGERPH